jgi:hypothetical protein
MRNLLYAARKNMLLLTRFRTQLVRVRRTCVRFYGHRNILPIAIFCENKACFLSSVLSK